MVEHVSSSIQFGLMVSGSVVVFVAYAMVSPACSDCDPTRVLDMNYGQFPA